MPTTSIGAPFEIFERLKAATAHVHTQIEERMPVFRPEFDLAGYIRLLERLYGFWSPLEANLSRVRALNDPALALQSRMKSQLLEADLRILGHTTTTLPECPALPFIGTLPSALGCLYVLEGSTLGARIISRRLESHLKLREGSGAVFFNAYGDATGRRWSEFRLFVTANVTLDQSEETVNAAVQTFESLFAWLEEPFGALGR
jgi:heme oxygenase (biliverdin-IX-beta and delta-forming)